MQFIEHYKDTGDLYNWSYSSFSDVRCVLWIRQSCASESTTNAHRNSHLDVSETCTVHTADRLAPTTTHTINRGINQCSSMIIKAFIRNLSAVRAVRHCTRMTKKYIRSIKTRRNKIQDNYRLLLRWSKQHKHKINTQQHDLQKKDTLSSVAVGLPHRSTVTRRTHIDNYYSTVTLAPSMSTTDVWRGKVVFTPRIHSTVRVNWGKVLTFVTSAINQRAHYRLRVENTAVTKKQGI